jgi:hypothetical protein
MALQYKVRHRVLKPGFPYLAADEFLNTYGQDGWELAAVVVTQSVMTDEIWEIFYLKKEIAPAGDSPPTG